MKALLFSLILLIALSSCADQETIVPPQMQTETVQYVDGQTFYPANHGETVTLMHWSEDFSVSSNVDKDGDAFLAYDRILNGLYKDERFADMEKHGQRARAYWSVTETFPRAYEADLQLAFHTYLDDDTQQFEVFTIRPNGTGFLSIGVNSQREDMMESCTWEATKVRFASIDELRDLIAQL